MGYYFEDHPQRVPQWNRVRRGNTQPSGVVVLHTAENVTDTIGLDTGAESVANYMTRRDSYGSYHRLIDSDSIIKLAPWESETFHDTATNRHSVGISAAVACKDWPGLYGMKTGNSDRGHMIINLMAAETADFIKWIKAAHGITVPVRRITRAEAHARRPGILGHGDSDPTRRTDPGAAFDWNYYLERVNAHLGKTTAAPASPSLIERVGKMDATHILFTNKGRAFIANILAGTYYHVPSPAALEERKTVLKRTGAILKEWREFTSDKKNNEASPSAFGLEIKGVA